MYLPKHFEQQDEQAMAQLLQLHPLATVAWQSADGLNAEHLPLMWERGAGDGAHGTLRGHVARANPVWRAAAGAEVLAVFQGPQAYISPSWYPSKAETGKVVPTWNYAVVHMHGRLRVTEDAAWLHALVERLTDTHEAAQHAPLESRRCTGRLHRADAARHRRHRSRDHASAGQVEGQPEPHRQRPCWRGRRAGQR